MDHITLLQISQSSGNFMSNGELVITGVVVVVGILTVIANYKIGINTKKFEYSFDRRVKAFRKLFHRINAFKNYCSGRMACIQGNEYAPFYTDKIGAFALRIEIANVISSEGVFLSAESRRLVNKLIDSMSQLCNLEATFALGENLDLESVDLYNTPYQTSDSILEALHNELDLPIK